MDEPPEGSKPRADSDSGSAHPGEWTQSDPSGQEELLHPQVAQYVIYKPSSGSPMASRNQSSIQKCVQNVT